MNQQKTTAIVLTRVEYGEADRIITVLTPDKGKLSLIAKGSRRLKSKLAGGIELFSTSEISYIPGRGSISTLVSARMQKHFSHITSDINRTMLGYELIKLLHTVTEDEPEAEYYEMLVAAFSALDDVSLSVELIRMWFSAQLLRQAGHTPNLQSITDGSKLNAKLAYVFDYDETAFQEQSEGLFGVNEIKFLRLVFSGNSPDVLNKVSGSGKLIDICAPLIFTLRQLHLRT